MSAIREVYEQRLAAAISRYVGYTTGAYDLDRIVSVANLLSSRPFRFDVEILQLLRKEHDIREDYARGIVDFAVGLGLLQRIAGEGAHSRLTLTDLGRSLQAAAHSGDHELRQFTLSFALLEYDADIYGLVLDSLARGESPESFANFSEAVVELRRERYEWLRQAFPVDALVRRVAEHVRWLDVKPRSVKVAEVGADFVRHHTTPRRGWAKGMGHVDEEGNLSETGAALVQRLRAGRDRYFWIGPDEETLQGLRLDPEMVPQPLGPAWSVLRPRADEHRAPERIVEAVGRFMVQIYPAVRLHRTNQAPLAAVLPYLYLQENRLGYRLNEDELLTSVFAQFSKVLAPLSGRGRKFGHYQLRAGA